MHRGLIQNKIYRLTNIGILHCGDKTILRLSFLHNGISHIGKTASSYWSKALGLTQCVCLAYHYSVVIIDAMASQITSLAIVYSTVYSGADRRKHQSSASLAFVRGIHRWPVNSPHKWPVTRKMFPFDDVIMSYSFFPVISACLYLLPEVSARPPHELTTEVTVQENATLLDSATNVTNFNVNVVVATTNQVSNNLTAGGNMTASFVNDTYSNVSLSDDPQNTPTQTYGSPQGSIDVSKSDIAEVTTTESPKTTTGMDPVPTIVRGTTSLEVPMHNAGSNTDSVEKHTYKGRRRIYEIVLRITLTVKETEIGGSANLKSLVQDSWVEDHKDDPEPNTDTTSAATAADTTESPTPPPTPVAIDAESMAGVRMCLTDARHKASDALENYVSKRNTDRNVLDQYKSLINNLF